MLADLSAVDPVHLKDVILIALAFAAPVAAWVGMYLGRRRSVNIQPQPLQVQGVSPFITRDICEQYHATTGREISDIKARVNALETGQREIVEKIGNRMDAVRDEIRDDREQSQRVLMDELTKVHNRINSVLEAVSEVRGASRTQRP